MSVFEYAGYDRKGRRCRGIIDARDARETRKRLAAQGILADKVSALHTGRGTSPGVKRQPAIDRIRFYEELGALLGADIPIVDALGILFSAPDAGIPSRVVAQVRNAIREGDSLASALVAVFDGMPSFEKAVIEAGQSAGALPLMLERLAGFMEAQRGLAEKVRAAMIYPVFVMVFALLMVLGIIGFGLPAVGRLLAETGMPLPFMIRASMQWGRWAAIAIVLFLAFATLALMGVVARATRQRRRRIRLEKILFAAPFVGTGYAVLVSLRFVRTLELLMTGGHPLVESLSLAGAASGSAWVQDDMNLASELLRHGGCTPSEATAASPPLKAVSLPAWVRSGEAAGALGKMLGRLADRLEKRWERFAVRSLNLLMPVVILVVGGFVLAATLSILIPILNLNRMLLQ